MGGEEATPPWPWVKADAQARKAAAGSYHYPPTRAADDQDGSGHEVAGRRRVSPARIILSCFSLTNIGVF